MKNREIIAEQLEKYDSFYLYDEAVIQESARALKRDFDGVEFLYSIKANAAPAVVRCVLNQGLGADAASLAEVRLAHGCGLPADRIHYSAPGKRDADLQGALPLATVVADSLGELRRIREIAQAGEAEARIGVRVNPNLTAWGGSGGPSKFGIDEEQLLRVLPTCRERSPVSIAGLHVHVRSQELDAGALARYYEKVLDLAERLQDALGRRLAFVNMGSGLGIPYSTGDAPLDTRRLGSALAGQLAARENRLKGVRIIIETGRYVVGKCGCYVAKVLDKKVSRGRVYVILSNTLNGFLRPSLEALMLRGGETPPAAEPLFTGPGAFQFEALSDSRETERVTLAGNLCTAADEMARDLVLPKLRRGDAVVVTNAGSYGAALSPLQFASQPPPGQLFLSCGGAVSDALAET